MHHSSAAQQILARLSRAESALNLLKNAVTLSDAREAWIDFISAIGTIYSKLEQACKTDKKKTAWFGKLKHHRRTDELLAYIHHARNSDEHSVDEITGVKVGESTITFIDNPKEGDTITFSTDAFGLPKITANSDAIRIDEYMHPTLIIVPVKDSRFGDIFQPPKQHLGKPITSLTPSVTAELAFSYVRNVVNEYCSSTETSDLR